MLEHDTREIKNFLQIHLLVFLSRLKTWRNLQTAKFRHSVTQDGDIIIIN